MFVDRGDKRVDVTAAVPKLKKLAFFFRLHRDQVRIGIEKLAEGGTKFFGVQLRKIDEGQIMLTESELPDNLARRRITQLGGKHNRAEDILTLRSRPAQSLTPRNESKVRPHAQPDETFLQRHRLGIRLEKAGAPKIIQRLLRRVTLSDLGGSAQIIKFPIERRPIQCARSQVYRLAKIMPATGDNGELFGVADSDRAGQHRHRAPGNCPGKANHEKCDAENPKNP